MSANTLLLLHGEELVDSSNHGRIISNNGVTVSSVQSKFGGKSLYFNGSSYLAINVPVSGDVTLEYWVYTTNYTQKYPTPCNHISGSSRGYYAHIRSTKTEFGAVNASGSTSGQELTTDVISANAWHHIAMVRSGTTMTLFVDGVNKGSIANSHTSNDILYMGYLPDYPTYTYFQGHVDEVRISDTARYTTNFTPPTEPFTVGFVAESHATLIGGTVREIESGTVLIGGVLREVESGLALVVGVEREIAFGPDDCTITLYGKRDVSNVRYLSSVEIDGTKYHGYLVAPSTQVVVAKGTQIELEVLSNNGNKIPYIKVNGTTVRTGDAIMMFTVTKDTNITLSYATQNDGDDKGGTIEITEL